MDRFTIQVGSYEVNCSIVSEGARALVVDPGSEGNRIARLLAQKGLEPAAILLTHGHFDHIGGVNDLQAAYPGLPVYVSILVNFQLLVSASYSSYFQLE